MNSGAPVLVAPLDWGLGHAARCIPLIAQLRSLGVPVLLGGAGGSLLMLRRQFPDLPAVELPAYGVRYGSGASVLGPLLRQSPRFFRVIRAEQAALRALHRARPLRGVISDNRYGLHLPGLPAALICHQIAPMLPAPLQGLRGAAYALHRRLLAPFSQVWIPDHPGPEGLSGELSHGIALPPHAHYIGRLSRFPDPQAGPPRPAGMLALVSGPEPQRSLFEARCLKLAAMLARPMTLIGGQPDRRIRTIPGVQYHPFADGPQLQEMLLGAELVLLRSGYSSLMDLAALDIRRMLLVPTPGQPEQEYLAQRLAASGIAMCVRQAEPLAVWARMIAAIAAESGARPGFPPDGGRLLAPVLAGWLDYSC
ncbi:MAG: glycosyltransferase [Bacteroidia bacterium]|nr:glycosyltransferase [Bacteroidia bacterium]